MRVQTSPEPETLAQREPRGRAEIEREKADLIRRKTEFQRDTISALEADITHEGERHSRALIEAVRADRERPSRENLDRAEAALRRAKEELVAFDGALEAIEAELKLVLWGEEVEQRDAYRAELETQKAALAKSTEDARVAQLGIEQAERRIPFLNQEIVRLTSKTGAP